MLQGGIGLDTLTGGAGADTFIFIDRTDSSANTLRDVITDFTHNATLSLSDRIDLSVMDANPMTTPNEAFAFVANGGAITNAAVGQIHARVVGTNSYIVEGHEAGHTTLDFQIQVTSTTVLVAADFIL